MDTPTIELDKILFEKFGITMTLVETAELLKLSVGTIRNMCARKDLMAKRAGTKWIIPTQSVINFLTVTPNPVFKPVPKKDKLIV